MTSANIWPIIKLRLGLPDNTLQPLIETYIHEIERRIMHYCAISKVPEALKFVWVSMAIDAVRIDLPNIREIANTVSGGALSVSVGDTSVSGGGASGGDVSNTSKAAIDQVVLNYRSDLNRHRKLRW